MQHHGLYDNLTHEFNWLQTLDLGSTQLAIYSHCIQHQKNINKSIAAQIDQQIAYLPNMGNPFQLPLNWLPTKGNL